MPTKIFLKNTFIYNPFFSDALPEYRNVKKTSFRKPLLKIEILLIGLVSRFHKLLIVSRGKINKKNARKIYVYGTTAASQL